MTNLDGGKDIQILILNLRDPFEEPEKDKSIHPTDDKLKKERNLPFAAAPPPQIETIPKAMEQSVPAREYNHQRIATCDDHITQLEK